MFRKTVLSVMTVVVIASTAAVTTTSASAGGFSLYLHGHHHHHQHQKRIKIRTNYWSQHVAWCYDNYRSFRDYDNTFQPFKGSRKLCISPFFQG